MQNFALCNVSYILFHFYFHLSVKIPRIFVTKVSRQCNVMYLNFSSQFAKYCELKFERISKVILFLQNLDRKKNWIKYLIIGDGGRRLSLYGARKVFRNNSVCTCCFYISNSVNFFPIYLNPRKYKLNHRQPSVWNHGTEFRYFSINFFSFSDLCWSRIISQQ